MSPGKVHKKVRAGFFVKLIEGGNKMLSNEFNIVVCTLVFFMSPGKVLKQSGGWILSYINRKTKRNAFD